MAIYRSVQLSFWTDNKIVDDFTPEDKYFYLYLFTNPQTNLCGCYEVSLSTMSNQLGYTKDSIERLIDRFEHHHRLIKYSKQTKELLIVNWSKYNWQGGNQEKCLLKEISTVKNLDFKRFLEEVFEAKFGETKGLTSPLQATVTVTDINNIYDFKKHNNKENLIYILNSDEKYEKLRPDFIQAMVDWMEYKDERPKSKNRYQEKGLKSWITETINMASENGTTNVIRHINKAMANQWQGTNYDLMEKANGK